MNLLAGYRLRKRARETLRYAEHVRNMRQDVVGANDLARLAELRRGLAAKARRGDAHAAAQACDEMLSFLNLIMPPRKYHGLRENLEILAVALTVAMAFRTYFVQPFKIPTGSMEPTLRGIQVEEADGPGLTDLMPFKPLKWVFTGRWYREVRVAVPGTLRYGPADDENSMARSYQVGPRLYRLPKAAKPRFANGAYMPAGSVLWSGCVITGDHVFVDRMRWNFGRPKRGQVVVFGTDTITGIPPDTHYIKRLVGMPGENISIDPPNVLADGKPIMTPRSIGRIAAREPGYARGYIPADPHPHDTAILTSSYVSLPLGSHEYFVLGDNTGNSRDGRYWGAVPEQELVGPAFMVYWPLSRRWGLMR